ILFTSFSGSLVSRIPGAVQLAAHQQPCEFKLYPGTLHAFLHYSRMMKTADEALRDGAQFFTAQL
ncbi:hypothetical protein NEF28_001112, partial [Escherichia coli]|nr:hypothetical protein [Escherichia coli]EJH9900957.1 hypothetical protein [Escherichia coli]EKN7986872.1 hypothetical protein [Escherichia coli]